MKDVLFISLKIALTATLFSAIPAIALAYVLARREFRLKSLVQTLVTLPMVLPPVAVGYFLLKLFSRHGPLGPLNLLFTWQAAAVASGVMAFPLLVRSAEQAFLSVPHRLELLALSLGKTKPQVFRAITLPLAKVGVTYGAVLFFLRALGEFGATNLVAGNIPGETQTLSLAIYSHVESFEDTQALYLVGVSIALSFGATLAAQLFLRRTPRL